MASLNQGGRGAPSTVTFAIIGAVVVIALLLVVIVLVRRNHDRKNKCECLHSNFAFNFIVLLKMHTFKPALLTLCIERPSVYKDHTFPPGTFSLIKTLKPLLLELLHKTCTP